MAVYLTKSECLVASTYTYTSKRIQDHNTHFILE